MQYKYTIILGVCCLFLLQACNLNQEARWVYLHKAYPAEIHLKVLDVDSGEPVSGVTVNANFSIPYYPDTPPLRGQVIKQGGEKITTDDFGRATVSQPKALSLRVSVIRSQEYKWIKPVNREGMETLPCWYFDKRKKPPVDGPVATAADPYVLYVKKKS